jgi:hypothetical protein
MAGDSTTNYNKPNRLNNGVSKGPLAFSAGAQAVLAGASDHRIADTGLAYRLWGQQCAGAVYLHLILTGMNAVKIKSNPVKTVLVITVGFLVFHLIFGWAWAIYASLSVGILGLLSTSIAQGIEWLWMKLTWVLSLIIPNILLSLVFFIVLTPVAWLSRLFGAGDPLMLKRGQSSTFKEVNKTFNAKSFEHPW